MPNLLYFLRTSTCYNHPILLEKYEKTLRDGLSKVCNKNIDNISSTQLGLPAKKGGLEVSSAPLSAFPAFLAPAVAASDIPTLIFRKHSKMFRSRERLSNG